ncbi:MAG: UDP-N-acetylmuramate dehydrogenase [Planctomycetota bacterium]
MKKEFHSLSEQGVGRIHFDVSLVGYTSWKIGGCADVLIEPFGAEGLSRVLAYIGQNKIPYIVIGDGSNILFSDEGFRGVVIRIGRAMSNITIEKDVIYAQAGVAMPRLARLAGVAGLSGIEHTSGIPGTLGGLVAMNGGSLRQTIGEAVQTIRCLDPSSTTMELGQADCEFSYRRSILLTKPWIVTDVVLKLQQGERNTICGRILEVLRERRHKFPRRLPNCGSVFKSDTELHEKCGPPGWIIEQLGLKGFSVGGAQVSTQHANFIINTGRATAADVLELIHIIRKKVHEKTNIWLECEVRYIGPQGDIAPAHLHSEMTGIN